MSKPQRFKLRLRSLKFISAVDQPAQPHALAQIIKRDTGDEVTASVQIAKVSDEGIVFGYALVATEGGQPHYDLHGDAISETELVKVAAEFLAAGGASDEMHDDTASGSVVFCYPLTTEIANALSITTDRTGLLVGIRPAPEVLAKFRSGEYTGFSIAGIGEREPEPVEKAAPVMVPADVVARIEALEKKLRDRQVAKATAELAANRDAEQTAWINGVAQSDGLAAARVVAGYNVAKAGAAPTWADRWLADHPAPAEVAKRGPESDAQVFRRRTSALAQASRAYESGRETFAKRVNKAAALVTNDYLATPEGAAVYAAYTQAQAAMTEGEPSAEELALTAEIDTLTAELTAMEEAFGLAQNLEPIRARERLPKVSPEYDRKFKRMYAASAERSNAVAARRAGATRIYSTGEELLAEQRAAQAAATAKAAMLPAERKLTEIVEKVAKDRGLARPAATTWALEHDPRAQAIYSVMAAEQAAGRALPEQLAKALAQR